MIFLNTQFVVMFCVRYEILIKNMIHLCFQVDSFPLDHASTEELPDDDSCSESDNDHDDENDDEDEEESR